MRYPIRGKRSSPPLFFWSMMKVSEQFTYLSIRDCQMKFNLRFSFLPAQRVSIKLDSPHLNTDKVRRWKYSNSVEHFCQIPSICRCSTDSLCLGKHLDGQRSTRSSIRVLLNFIFFVGSNSIVFLVNDRFRVSSMKFTCVFVKPSMENVKRTVWNSITG